MTLKERAIQAFQEKQEFEKTQAEQAKREHIQSLQISMSVLLNRVLETEVKPEDVTHIGFTFGGNKPECWHEIDGLFFTNSPTIGKVLNSGHATDFKKPFAYLYVLIRSVKGSFVGNYIDLSEFPPKSVSETTSQDGFGFVKVENLIELGEILTKYKMTATGEA